MADDLLIAIDEAFARSKSAPVRQRPSRTDESARFDGQAAGTSVDDADADEASTEPRATSLRDRLPWLELFLAVQFLWGALMFIPGAQQYRGYIRALPYVSSLGLLGLYLPAGSRTRRPGGAALLICALLLLVVNLVHPTSQFAAGLAQCTFQLSIAAPMFWAYKNVRSARYLERLLLLVFVMNFASAALGVLQVYFPDRFMPPQFNSLGLQLNEYYVESLTYLGRDGRVIVRPPGLTDQPGGAAIAGGLTVLLGLGLSMSAGTVVRRLAYIGTAAIGLAVIYLTQVRSVLLMVIGCVAILSVVAVRQRRVAAAAWILATGGGLVIAAFMWASSIGGDSVAQRFLNIRDQGVIQTYQENRGHYLTNTTGELLNTYPLGAGVGRWGMMNTYFGDPSDLKSAPFHVEPQVTGWLLDGGIPMWLLYGGAILMALFTAFRLCGSRSPSLAHLAIVTITLEAFIVGLGMAGPIFNTQTGLIFWVLASALHGAAGEPISAARNSRSYAAADARLERLG